MSKKRQRHSAEFKAKVALEAIKGIKTLQQLAKDFQVHPTQLTMWKKQLTGQWRVSFTEAPRAQCSPLKKNCARPMKRLAAWISSWIG